MHKSKIIALATSIAILLAGCSSGGGSKSVDVAMVEKAELSSFDMYVTTLETHNKLMKKVADNGTTYLVTYVQVKNTDKESHTIDSSNFTLKDADGNSYRPVTEPTLYDPDAFANTQFGPQVQKIGLVVFEVPDSVQVNNKVMPGYEIIYKNGSDSANFDLSERVGKLASDG